MKKQTTQTSIKPGRRKKLTREQLKAANRLKNKCRTRTKRIFYSETLRTAPPEAKLGMLAAFVSVFAAAKNKIKRLNTVRRRTG